jgi:ABC-2 type transport system permease protein
VPGLFLINQATLNVLFAYVPWIYVFLIPAITMSLISREKDNGTIESLTTFPLSDTDIVAGKFLSAVMFMSIGLLCTMVHFVTIAIIGQNVDYGAILCGYIGLFLMGASYSAIGVFASTLSSNQIVAFIVSLLIVLFLSILNAEMLMFLPDAMRSFLHYISSHWHFSNMARGIIDTRNLIYFVSLIVIFLRLAIFVMGVRRWK